MASLSQSVSADNQCGTVWHSLALAPSGTGGPAGIVQAGQAEMAPRSGHGTGTGTDYWGVWV